MYEKVHNYTDDFAGGKKSVKRVYFDEISSLTLVQAIFRQRVDVLLDHRRPQRRRRPQRTTELCRGSGDHSPRPTGCQRPRSDRRRPCQQAADREGAGPWPMTDRVPTWVVRMVAHCQVRSETRRERFDLIPSCFANPTKTLRGTLRFSPVSPDDSI